MTRKNVWVFFFLCGILFTLAGCDFLKKTTTIETTIPTTIETTTESALTLKLKAIYNLAVEEADFTGTYEEWLETVRGPQGVPGENGEEIELQVASGYIQWRYVDSSVWTNLVSLESLRGEDGIDGKQVLFRVDSGYIQWQYSGDLAWINLISIDLLIGENGKEVTFQVDGGYLQYQYEGDLIWTNLIELASLIGPQGLPGQEIELRVNDAYLEWRYSGTEIWYFLYDLITLKGQDATFPVITISEDGYWVIDGVVQTQKAYAIDKYIVTFDSTGGLMPEGYPWTIEVDKGNSLNLPTPTKAGYVFKGWVTGYSINDVLFNNYLPITKNVDLFAKWEVDEQLLYDLFEQVNEDHFFDYTMNVDFTNGIDSYYYDVYNNYYLYSSAVEPYDYLYSHTLVNMPYIFPSDTISTTYSQYDDIRGDYVSAKTRNGSAWYFERYETYEKYDHFLNGINPSSFQIRPEGLIYDYTGDMSVFEEPFINLFSMFGLGMTGLINYSEQYCFLDLIDQTITYYAVGTSDIPTIGISDFVFSVIYDFNDFDSTLATIPSESIKQSVLNRFDIAVTNKYSDEYIEYVYEESLLEFDALVLEKQTLLNSISTIVDLGNFYLYEISEITNFSFVYDEISMYKNEILKMMASDLAYKTTQASVESIAEMNLLYQQYEALILNLTDLEVYEDYGMVLYYEYLNLLEAAYVIDLEKIAFSIYRESIASKIYLFMAYLSETFADELEREQYLLLVDNWINNIRLQSTKEDVLLSYNQAITEITSFVYMQNIPMGHVYFCSDDFIGLMINNSYLSADSMAYETYVLDISQNLYNYIDLNLWILEMINLYDLSQSYLLSEMILSETPEITAYVNDLYTMISDDDVLTLQTEYDKLMILLPEATTTFCFQQLVDVFNTNAANIPFDEWKLAKIDANSIVEGEYNYLILTASNESELLLTEDLNDFYLALTSIIENDFTSLKSLRDLTLSNFALDYEPAPEFAELVSLRIEYLQLWEEFYLVGIPYLDTYYQSIDALENIYLWYRQEIKYASTEIDITNLYLNGVHELIYLPVVYLRFDMYIDSLIAQETAYVNNWYGQHPIYDTQVFIYLDLFIEDIYSSATPYYAYDVYLYYKDTIDQIILYEMQYDYQNILRQDYLDYQLILDSSYLSELGDIYNYYYNLLDIEIIWSNFQIHIDNFHLEVNALLPTQWELDLEEATFTINHEYDYRMLTASIASQPLLTEDLDEFNLALLNLEIDDYEGLQLLIDNTINNFTLDYETNPQYLDLYQAKLEYLQKWEEFYLVGIPYVNTEFSSLAELDDLYLNYRQSLRLMTTISGLESVYNQGVSAFSNLMFDYISITPLINEFLTSINSYVDAWELEYSLTSTSVDSLVNNFTVNIYGYPSPYAAYAYYLECREQIDIQILAYMVYHYQSLLDIAYNDYYVTIDPIYHMDLESIYYSHYDILETETVWANFQVIIDNFHIEVAALVNP